MKMNNVTESIIVIFALIIVLVCFYGLEAWHKEKYKDYYYIQEYKTPIQPPRR